MSSFRNLILLLCIGISMSGCSSDIKMTNSNDKSVDMAAAENAGAQCMVLLDETPLQTKQKNTVTAIVSTELTDWEYTASSAKGKITNKKSYSFDYTRPADDEQEDEITVLFLDKETGRKYKFSLPLVFVKPTNREEKSPEVPNENTSWSIPIAG